MTYYAQMVWLRHCVDVLGKCLCSGQPPILRELGTLDRFQGLQAQVILVSLLSNVPGIISNVCRASWGCKGTSKVVSYPRAQIAALAKQPLRSVHRKPI